MGNTNTTSEFYNNYRLSESTRPLEYDLTIKPNLVSESFGGEVTITFEQLASAEAIFLHALELEVTSSDKDIQITKLPDLEQIRISKKGSKFHPGAHQITLQFSGKLNQQLRGFYKSVYKDSSGNEKIIATTHFEPADARRAFPCFDEPDKKAKFKITLIVDNHLLAVSNWDIESTGLQDSKKIVKFNPTIPMSSYLVAFVVGELSRSKTVKYKDIPIEVICVPSKESLADFALEVAAFSLEFFSDYFAIDYPGKKLDLIALPDFAFGAMENLGAVTFRETALLVDKDKAARVDLERVADVVAHELAHMWFGDLVTMKWWNGIWLNEAFATFMELLCVDALYPNWQRWVTFGLSREAAMAVDSLSSTRPIEYQVNRPEEAEGMFDVLTYQKGASVLRMIEQFLSPDIFKAGIRQYLSDHLYSNTQTEDLWRALEASSKASSQGYPVLELMNSWIYQGGYPLVTVTLLDKSIKLAQEPFKLNPSGPSGAIGNKWLVPIQVKDKNSDFSTQILLSDEWDVLSLPNNPELLIVNAGGWGFYRVNYDQALLETLFNNLDKLEPLELFNLTTDLLACAIAGYAPLSNFLKLSNLLGRFKVVDTNILSVVSSANYMFEKILDKKDMGILEEYTRAIFSVPFAILGWHRREGEEENDRTARATVISTLGALGKDPHIISYAKRLFEQHKNARDEIDPDLLGTVLNLVAQNGSENEYELIYEGYKNPLNPQYEQRHLFALGNFTQPDLIHRTLQMCLSEIRTQDAPFLLATMLTNRDIQQQTWNFIEENFEQMLTRYPTNALVRMCESARTLYSDPALAEKVINFFKSHQVPSGEKAIAQTLERLEINLNFAQREKNKLPKLLRDVVSS